MQRSHDTKEFRGVLASEAEPWTGNQPDVLREEVSHGWRDGEKIAVAFSYDRRLTLYTDSRCPRRVRGIDGLESDIECQNDMSCKRISFRDGEGGHRSRFNMTIGAKSSSIRVESTYRDGRVEAVRRVQSVAECMISSQPQYLALLP